MIDAVGDEVVELFGDSGADGIEIRLQAGDEDTGDRRDTYTNLLQAEETDPDLLLMDNGWVNVFIQRGQIANLSDALGDDDLAQIEDEYFESFTATAREPETNDLFGVPIFPDYPTMQYRKDYAREAGYGEDDFEEWATEPMTWAEWAELTEEIVEASDASYGLATQWDIYEGPPVVRGTRSCHRSAARTSAASTTSSTGRRPTRDDRRTGVRRRASMMRTFVADEHDEYTDEEYPTGIAPNSILGWQEENAGRRSSTAKPSCNATGRTRSI